MKTSIISPNLSGCVSILDCGVTYLATYINEKTDHEATIWDYTFNRHNWKNYVTDKFNKDKPDVIGITFTTLYKKYVEDTILHIRNSLSKDVKIVIGGVHPTLKPEDGFMDGVDAVVIGEGEPAFHEIMDNMDNKNCFEDVKGVHWKSSDGEIIKNYPRGWIKDINELPFPNYELWDDVDKYLFYLQQLWLVGTRGCPYPCTNCEEVQMYKLFDNSGASPSGIDGTAKRFRFRDPKLYAEEIAYHYDKFKNRGLRMAHPFDPVFPINREWSFKFAEEYIKTGISDKLPLSIFSRADSFYVQSPKKGEFDEDRLIALKEAGIKEIRVGVESGSERMRNGIHKKGVTNNQIRETFRQCRKHGLQTISYNMLGGPTETKKELIETFKLNREIKPNKPIFFVYQELTHDVNEIVDNYNKDANKSTKYSAPKTNKKEKLGLIGSDHGFGINPNQSWFMKSLFKILGRTNTDLGTIQFGEPMKSKHYSKAWLITFQYFCYGYFIGKRVVICVYKQKFKFFINFYKVMYQGYKDGVNMKIVFAYFLSATDDNLFT
jgi:radical SAM superfamily enzyme YgiQ (UPF0313 family)